MGPVPYFEPVFVEVVGVYDGFGAGVRVVFYGVVEGLCVWSYAFFELVLGCLGYNVGHDDSFFRDVRDGLVFSVLVLGDQVWGFRFLKWCGEFFSRLLM